VSAVADARDVAVPTRHEIELKLRIPADRLDAVHAAVRGKQGSTRTHLVASYLDTDGFDLAAAGMGWRLRREGRRWVQTLKATPRNGDGLRREEDNVVVKGPAVPTPDPDRHLGTPAGDRLAELLASTGTAPSERFRTDIWRLSRTVRVSGGRVELALDQGTITSADRSLDVCELEIELKSGDARTVVGAAHRWAQRYGLWLDTATKAHRGVMLSTGATELPVRKAPNAELHRSMSVDAAIREMSRVCLVQILGNTSAVAAGLGSNEHVHQARVGIRKLRTVLAEFGPLSTSVDPTWRSDLAEVFAVLGEARDREVVLAGWLAELERQGSPKVALPTAPADHTGEMLRGIDFTILMLELLGYAHGTPDPAADDEPKLTRIVAGRLKELRRHSAKRADEFRSLGIEDQHDVRKELKRLRYIAELTASLYDRKKVERYVQALEPAQDALGLLNDLSVATELFEALAAVDPNAWFAVGWLRSRHDATVKACVKPLRAAEKADRYWVR
jgi:inorganic triphosphatase YgiF